MKAFALILLVSNMALAAETISNAPSEKIKYNKGKDHSFDSQLVEGQIYRPDLSVVTGDTALGGTGVLRLRKNFADRATSENGEVTK